MNYAAFGTVRREKKRKKKGSDPVDVVSVMYCKTMEVVSVVSYCITA